MIKNHKKLIKKDQKYGQILGIGIISTPKKELLIRVKKNLSHNNHFYIVTPNPELILIAKSSPILKEALNASEFPVPDGIGLAQAHKFLSFKRVNIVFTFFEGLWVGLMTLINQKYLTNSLTIYKGRELFLDLIRLSDKNKWKVFFLGGERGESYQAMMKLMTKYQKVRFAGEPGPILNKKGEPVTEVDRRLEKDAVDKINKFAPDLLFVAFGNPKQEIWINKNIGKLRIGGAMCVGGTLRYIAGMSKLPPKWMEKVGLEWLWRLLTEPKRIGRIINASIVFPWKVFLYKLKN